MTATALLPDRTVPEGAFMVNDLSFTPSIPWRATTAPQILIVEDDPDVHDGWALFLRHHGYDVSSTDNGPRGLELIDTEEPDVVILDLGLPGMHGFKILHEMRMLGLSARVIVVSATVSADVERRAYALGAAAVLPKPVNMHYLVSITEDLLAS